MVRSRMTFPRETWTLSQLDRVLARSVHPSTADIRGLHRHVRFVPEAETPISFDNLNGLFANTVGDRHPERLCCPQVDAHVE